MMIILQDEHENQIEKMEVDTNLTPEDWEESLFQSHPQDWRIIGFRERTLVTRFGDVTVNRHLYLGQQRRASLSAG